MLLFSLLIALSVVAFVIAILIGTTEDHVDPKPPIIILPPVSGPEPIFVQPDPDPIVEPTPEPIIPVTVEDAGKPDEKWQFDPNKPVLSFGAFPPIVHPDDEEKDHDQAVS